MLPDLTATRRALRAGSTTASIEIERCIAAASAPANALSFVQTTFDEARGTAAQPGVAVRPLAGLAVSVKDLFDLSPTRYYQILNQLIDNEDALAHDPMLIKRLRRQRARRQRSRSARRLGIEL